MQRFLPLAATFLLSIALVPSAPAQPPAASAAEPALASYLDNRAEASDAIANAEADRRRQVWKTVETFYARRSHQPVWTRDDGRPTRRAGEVIEALRGADRHGLAPEIYRPDELAQCLDRGDRLSAEEAHQLDVELTSSLLLYASHLLRGRVSPEDVDRKWYIEPRQADLGEILAATLERGDRVEDFLDAVAPPHEGYDRLLDALERTRRIARDGGWPQVPDGPVLEAGDAAEPARLTALIDRFEIGGDLERKTAERLSAGIGRGERASGDSEAEAAAAGPVYGEELAEALRRFQRRHGLAVDGKLGPNSTAALNVTAEQRARQIELNLERWRWVPADLGRRHVHVNLAAQRLTAQDGDGKALEMAVVVGKNGWQTPVFSDRIDHVVINPYWNVPQSIARADILPRARKDPSYLAKNGFDVYSGYGGNAKKLDPSAVDWGSVGASDVSFRQRPGPGNALGQIKFMFPNNFNVYLHDTPATSLFERADRALSHGCVRVERPLELADFVFAGMSDWNAERVRQVIASREHTVVRLDQELPVHLLYWTAFVDDGTTHFRADVYGHDEALSKALGERRERLPAIEPPTVKTR